MVASKRRALLSTWLHQSVEITVRFIEHLMDEVVRFPLKIPTPLA